MDLIPTFEIGLWNAWFFIVYLMFFTALYFFTDLKKRGYPENFKMTKQEKRFEILENVFRIPAFLYPIFLPLQLGTTWFYIGLPITIVGMILYAIVYVNMKVSRAERKPRGTGCSR